MGLLRGRTVTGGAIEFRQQHATSKKLIITPLPCQSTHDRLRSGETHNGQQRDHSRNEIK
jgi:hypothetical protein